MTKPSHRVLAQQIKNAPPITDQSPHLCRSTRQISTLTLEVPLLPPIDQWGYVPFPLQRLTPHSLSRLAHRMLAGDFVAHRQIAIEEEAAEPKEPTTPAQVEARVYSREDSRQAWARRSSDLRRLAHITSALDEIDARAKKLEERAAAMIAQDDYSPNQKAD